jgi:hypothetical protein
MELSKTDFLTNEDFRMKTQLQLEKDFAVHGYFFSDEFQHYPLDYQSIFEQTQDAVMYFLEKNQSAWQALLYTIDFSEEKYLSFIHSNAMNSELLEKLVQGIIEREALKVHFRLKYSA